MSSGSSANVSASARSASSGRPSRRSSTTRRLRAWQLVGPARSAASTRPSADLVAALPGVDDRQLVISAGATQAPSQVAFAKAAYASSSRPSRDRVRPSR